MRTNIDELANRIVHYSIHLQKGDKVLIEAFDVENLELITAFISEIQLGGGYPLVSLRNNQLMRDLLLHATKEQVELWTKVDQFQMEAVDAYIGIRGSHNIFDWSDIPDDKTNLYNQIYQKEVHFDHRIKKKWVVLRYPNPSVAQLANMSTRAFEKFFYEVGTVDYQKMSEAMEPLIELMNRTDVVTIKGPGTELQFSIQGENSFKCAGIHNIPDGEVFTAPVKNSVNGYITFNTPSPYNGFVFEHVKLTFRDGKIVEATANDTKRLENILDTDAGARYLGEFALGLNPYILSPMKDILFDEKINGSLHLAIGNCVADCSNGNQSSIHWDMVLIQRPEFGGGEIWFDHQLIRKNGRFMIRELEGLNPENLM
jgi:aminopeptidase